MNQKQYIKSKIGQFNLKRRLKDLKRRLVVHNFNTAKTAGIIFNSPDEKTFESIKHFLSFLSDKGINGFTLCYIPLKKVPANVLLRNQFHFYCKTDLNWYYKPTKEIVEQFINKEFDILFDLSIKDYFTVNYVGKLSKATFKIGKQSETSYHDLTFEIKENETVDFLIEQIKHYLNILNN